MKVFFREEKFLVPVTDGTQMEGDISIDLPLELQMRAIVLRDESRLVRDKINETIRNQ